MLRSTFRQCLTTATRPAAVRRSVMTASPITKPEGDISSVFASLSGRTAEPLPERFAQLKQELLAGHERQLQASWDRLLPVLEKGVAEIRKKGPQIIPEVSFKELSTTGLNSSKIAEIRHRGAVVIRGVLPQAEALALKQSAKDYIAANKGRVRAFPVDKPAVYELYWSPPQLQARAHHNMLTTQVALQRLWHSSDPNTELSTRHPVSYADRLRMRQPGDAGFSLGAHCDGGGLERWEDEEYRRVYTRILEGHWEEYDPYDAKHRLGARMDLYGTRGGCTMFRMWQGWLSMSNTGPGEGTLKLFPLLRESTAYTMLRPFFTSPSFAMATASDSTFPGSVPAAGQEFNPTTHPHLDLDHTMTSVPRVAPGDFVAWHCDALHAVDPLHGGTGDASVLYIPATPLCALNAKYARHQRDAFKAGSPPADFPGAGGPGESGFVGGLDWEARLSEQGKRAMGFGGRGWEVTDDMTQGERRAVEIGNSVLFEGR